jgi:hypothetical protein
MPMRSRSAPFSTHARGVPLFDRGRFFDISQHAMRALLDLRDVGSSVFWFAGMQNWLTTFSVMINIVSGETIAWIKLLIFIEGVPRTTFRFLCVCAHTDE